MTTSSIDDSGAVHRALRDIVHDYGPDALDDAGLTAAMLKDLLPRYPREVAAARAAAEQRVAGRLWTRVETAQVYTAVAEIAYDLATTTAIEMNAALWVVTAYAIVLGLHPPIGETDASPPPPSQPSAPAAPPQTWAPWSSEAAIPPDGSAPGSAPWMPPPGGAPGSTPSMPPPGGAPSMPPPGSAPGTAAKMPPMGSVPGGPPPAPVDAPRSAPAAPRPPALPPTGLPPAQQPAAAPAPTPSSAADEPLMNASPSVGPAPAPRKTRSKSGSKSGRGAGAKSAVERAVASSLRKGLLTFTTPESMRQGRKERVEVGIARSTDLETELDGLFRTSAPRSTEVIETAEYMTVEVIGDAFTIVSVSRPNQLVVPLARWEFDVTPKQSGDHTLTIVGTCWITVGADQREISLPSFERKIRVDVDVVFGFRRALSTNWQWIVGTVAGLGAAIAGWVALFK